MKAQFEFEILNQLDQDELLEFISPVFRMLKKITFICHCGATTETIKGDVNLTPEEAADKDTEFIDKHQFCERNQELCLTRNQTN